MTCLAIADGAGSRPLSGQGAELAVSRAVLIASAYSGRAAAVDLAAWLQLVFRDVREQIGELAAAAGRDVGDYATTLGVAILTCDLVCIGQVGDTIAVVGSGDQFRTLAPLSTGNTLTRRHLSPTTAQWNGYGLPLSQSPRSMPCSFPPTVCASRFSPT